MKMSIFGLGYVGMVNAVCLAQKGHEVYGIDVNPNKVQLVNAGRSPLTESHVESLLEEQRHTGRIQATTTPLEAVAQSQLSLICVGTPSTPEGAVVLSQVEQVCKQIGMVLRHAKGPHTVVFRSTMLPGSTCHMAQLLADTASRRLGQGLHVAFNPEFLREGTAVQDFYSPPYTIIGTQDAVAASLLQEMYGFLSAPLYVVDVAVAELVKYASNAFHATKVTFANEIGRLARTWGVDGAEVMALLCRDTLLNVSPAYLRPGFAYGGSCLPKDVRALVWKARQSNLHIPLLESLSRSNQLQVEHAYELIARAVQSKEHTIGFLGLAFKAGTDDLRESPMVELVERLLGKGYRLRLYDENVSLVRLMGTNREFIDRKIPHLADLMAESPAQVVQESRVLVMSRQCDLYEAALCTRSARTTLIRLEEALIGRNRPSLPTP